MNNNDIIVYTVAESAKILRISKSKAYELVKAGILPALKLGGLKIPKPALEKFFNDYIGYDLCDLSNVKKMDFENLQDED